MREKRTHLKIPKISVNEYELWTKEARDNLNEVVPDEFDNALLLRSGIEENMKEYKKIPEFDTLYKRIRKADEVLKEALKNPETMTLYGGAINFAKKYKDWWWHPEKINLEALKYLPKDWPKIS